jgi:fatty acid desaturase
MNYILLFYLAIIIVDGRHIKLVVMRGYKVMYKILFILRGTLKMHEHQGKCRYKFGTCFLEAIQTCSTDEWLNWSYHNRN